MVKQTSLCLLFYLYFYSFFKLSLFYCHVALFPQNNARHRTYFNRHNFTYPNNLIFVCILMYLVFSPILFFKVHLIHVLIAMDIHRGQKCCFINRFRKTVSFCKGSLEVDPIIKVVFIMIIQSLKHMKCHHDQKKCVCEGNDTCSSGRISSSPSRSRICRETQMTPGFYVRGLLHASQAHRTYILFIFCGQAQLSSHTPPVLFSCRRHCSIFFS